MMNVIIIEDEESAGKRLQKLVKEMMPGATIGKVISSVKEAVLYFKENEPALIFADIQLTDGESFDIFRQVEITSPIIFTTAYDSYAIHAFKLNSIDYLLKPIKKEDLKNAIAKYKKLQSNKTFNGDNLKLLLEGVQKKPQYKERFIVRIGEHMKTIQVSEVGYFYTENKANFMVLKNGKRYLSEFTLDQLDAILNPREFFRINRQFIIGISSINEMHTYSKSRVHITLDPPCKIETVVSTERSAPFKSWLAGE